LAFGTNSDNNSNRLAISATTKKPKPVKPKPVNRRRAVSPTRLKAIRYQSVGLSIFGVIVDSRHLVPCSGGNDRLAMRKNQGSTKHGDAAGSRGRFLECGIEIGWPRYFQRSQLKVQRRRSLLHLGIVV